MNSGFELFYKEAILVKNVFPGLDIMERDFKQIIAGELVLIDNEGIPHKSYSIEIHPVLEYPFRFPLVFETGGRIPVNIDWHIFESDGHCCLKTYAEELLICKKGLTLNSFIEKEVKPYFFNQAFREHHGYFMQERSHGYLGELEFFFELFRTRDLEQLYKLITFTENGLEPHRTDECFCGSREKYRRCHRNAFRVMVQFTNQEIKLFKHKIVHSPQFINEYPLLALTEQGRFI